MEEAKKQTISNFLEVARKMLTCYMCGSCVIRNGSYCYNSHCICRICLMLTGNSSCSSCKNLLGIKRCVVLDKFAECLSEPEKLVNEEKMLEQLEGFLECTVCYDRVTPDFQLCSVGHMICYNCWVRVVVCPICNSTYSHVVNTLLINLIKIFPYRCSYSERGCRILGCRTDIIKHELDCQYREFYCQVQKCFWKGGSENHLMRHLRSLHPKAIRSSDFTTVELSVFKLQQNIPQYSTNFITFNGKSFWQHFYCVHGNIKFIALMLGSPNDAKNYEVVVAGNNSKKTFNVFSDANLDINCWFNKEHPSMFNITNLVNQRLVKGTNNELAVFNEFKVSIIKKKPFLRKTELVGLTLLGGLVMYLLYKVHK